MIWFPFEPSIFWWNLELLQQKEPFEFGELEWLADVGLLGEQITQEALAAAEVPQLPVPQSSNVPSYRPIKSNTPYKKPRIEMPVEDDEFFIVPDLGWT